MPRKEIRTLGDVITVYWGMFELHNRVDSARPEGIFQNHFLPFFQKDDLTKITAGRLQEYLLYRKRQGASNGTMWRELRLFKCLMNLGNSEDWVSNGKFRYIGLPPEENRERVVTIEELNRIRHKATDDMWELVIFALHTGLRLGAILSVDPKDSEFIQGWNWLRVPKAQTKSKVNCPFMPLTRSAFRVVTNRQGERLFTRWATPEAVGKAWRTTCKNAKVENLHFHDLRHTFSTWLEELSVDVVEVLYLMGHVVGGTTKKRYSHADPRYLPKLQKAVSLLSKNRDLPPRNAEVAKITA